MARKSVLERKSLSKEERVELRQIKSKFHLGRRELTAKTYLQHLQTLEQANQKLKEIYKKEDFLGEKNLLATKLTTAQDKQQLDRWLKRAEKVLTPEYEENVQQGYRRIVIDNLQKALGTSVGVEKLTTTQLANLIKRNPQLSFLLQYHRGQELQANMELFDVDENFIEEAIYKEVAYYSN